MSYRMTKSSIIIEGKAHTVYGLKATYESGEISFPDISADREFVKSLIERIVRLGVSKEFLLEVIEEALAEHCAL